MFCFSVKPKRLCLAVGSASFILYAVHITFETVILIDRKCGGSVNVKSSRQGKAVLRNLKTIDFDPSAGFEEKRQLYMSVLDRTDYFTCKDFAKLPNTTQAISENKIGNRGISFMKVRIEGVIVPIVYKQANRYPLGQRWNKFVEQYKFNTAKREIEYLIKLQGLPGIPRLFGSCVTKTTANYLVERIEGSMMCNDNGTTVNCSKADYLMSIVLKSSDPVLAALKLSYTTTRLFKLLEERQLVYEDISGVNLMFSPQFEVFTVDLDSLVYYNDSRLSSKLQCTANEHCSGPVGNLWVGRSLNARIHENCLDLNGLCEGGRCRGFDISLHACGMANWYICKLSRIFKEFPDISEQYLEICLCLKQPHPTDRCTFAYATEKLKSLLDLYETIKSIHIAQ